MIIFLIIANVIARIVEEVPITWHNYTATDLQIFYNKWCLERGCAKEEKNIRYPVTFVQIPQVALSIQQITHWQINGRIHFKLQASDIDLTSFTISAIEEGSHQVFRNWIFVLATSNPLYRVQTFTINNKMSGVVNNNGQVTFSVGFSQLFTNPPKVQVFANGYDMVPKLNIFIDGESNYDDPEYGFSYRLSVLTNDASSVQMEFYYLSNSYVGNFQVHGVLMTVAGSADSFSAIDSPPTWIYDVNLGSTSNGTGLRVKSVSADTQNLDTGGLFISTIFWGLSGVHTPALNAIGQDGIVAIYCHVQLSDGKYNFFIEGNPDPCVANWLFYGQINFILFKHGLCFDPYFFNPTSTKCVRCHPYCRYCKDKGETMCTMCWNNMTFSPSLNEKLQLSTGEILPVGPCICVPGTFLEELRCYPCHHSCLTCDDRWVISCTNVCPPPTTGRYQAQRVKLTFSCPCQDVGYYENGQQQCGLCSKQCYKCLGPEDYSCTSCHPETGTYNLRLRLLDPNSKMGTCGCTKTTYQYGTYCHPCHQTCEGCIGKSRLDCVECIRSKQLKIHNQKLKSGECICLEGQYPVGLMDCSSCHYSCKTCISSYSQNCTSCFKDRRLNILQKPYGSGICDCPEGQYRVNEICISCYQTCASCVDSKENSCTECKPSLVWGERQKNKLGTCVCFSHQYYNKLNHTCIDCHQRCLTCYGPYKFNCITCKGQLKISSTGECLCPYNKIEVLENNSFYCTECEKKCSICTQGGCLSCANFRVLPPQCFCMNGYYEQGEDCIRCPGVCRLCRSERPSDCQECQRGLIRDGADCVCKDRNLLFNEYQQTCTTCLNLVYEWAFDKYQYYHYLTITFEKPIGIYIPLTNDSNHYIDQNNDDDDQLKYLFFNMTMFHLNPLIQCAREYILFNISTTDYNTKLIYRIRYNLPFQSLKIAAIFKWPQFIVNKTNLTLDNLTIIESFYHLHPIYGQYGEIYEEFGPYMLITDKIRSEPIYQWLAEVFSSDYHEQYSALKQSYIIPLLFPTLWGLTTVLHIGLHIPTNMYFFLGFITQFTAKNLTKYSNQNRVRNISTKNFYFSENDTTVLNQIQKSPEHLQSLQISSLFLFDAAYLLLVLSIIFAVAQTYERFGSRLIKQNSEWFQYVGPLLTAISWAYFRNFFYILLFYALLEIKVWIIGSQLNLQVLSLFIAVFIIIFQLIGIIYVGQRNMSQLCKSQRKFLYLYQPKESWNEIREHFLTQWKYYVRFYSFYGTTQRVLGIPQYFKLFTLITKRAILAVIMVSKFQAQDKLIMLLMIQIFYMVMKVILRPYQRNTLFTFKLFGDVSYVVVLVISLITHNSLEDQFNQIKGMNQCNNIQAAQSSSDLIDDLGLATIAASIAYIFFYSLDYPQIIYWELCRFSSKAQVEDIDEQISEESEQLNNTQRLITETETEEVESVVATEEDQTTYFVPLYKQYEYSKLSTSGVCYADAYLTISWESQLIDDGKGSSGVRYIWKLENKSKYKTISFQNLILETYEFEILKDVLQMSNKRSLAPQAEKLFEIEVLMKFASLDTYQDRIEFKGEWFQEGKEEAVQNFSYKVCSSECKLITNLKMTQGDLIKYLEDIRDDIEDLTELDHCRYDLNYLAILLTEHCWLDRSTLNIAIPKNDYKSGDSYIARMETHFHLYVKLEFLIELRFTTNINTMETEITIQVLSQRFDRNLIEDSGYLNVIETFVDAMAQFLGPRPVLMQKDNPSVVENIDIEFINPQQ